MDLINQVKILKMLKDLANKEITSVIIMHDLNLALKYADLFLGITKKHKVIQENAKEFFNIQTLKNVFNMDFEIIENGGNLYVQIID